MSDEPRVDWLPEATDLYDQRALEPGVLEIELDSLPLLQRLDVAHQMGAVDEDGYLEAIGTQFAPLLPDGVRLLASPSFIGPAAGDQYRALFHLVADLDVVDITQLIQTGASVVSALRKFDSGSHISKRSAIALARNELRRIGEHRQAPLLSAEMSREYLLDGAADDMPPGGWVLVFGVGGRLAVYVISLDGRIISRRIAQTNPHRLDR